jgi:CheY-like chemotaxis protein
MEKFSVLLVEDNEGDIILTKEALESSRYIGQLITQKNGQAAIDYLDNVISGNDSVLPDIILLDINLPKKNGLEVLQYIKSHDKLKHLPVLMLTTSSSEKDIMTSYQNHANCFISKPIEIDQFMELITKVEEFWLNTVAIPNRKKSITHG